MLGAPKASITTNNALIDTLKDEGKITVKEVEEVMRRVDRRHYVAPDTDPYGEHGVSIGFNATISPPHTHAMALEMMFPALKTGRRKRALDVGAGSGYLTACMALLQGERGGLVIGIEHIPELAEFAEENIRRDQPELIEGGRVRIVVGDGRLGFPNEAPFDAIHVGAAVAKMPEELATQLASGGVMVVPVGTLPSTQQLLLVKRAADGTLQRMPMGLLSFLPLTDADAQRALASQPGQSVRHGSVVYEQAIALVIAESASRAAAADARSDGGTKTDDVRPVTPRASIRRSVSFASSANSTSLKSPSSSRH